MPLMNTDGWLPFAPISNTDTSYGFGWANGQYRGFRKYWHDGGTLGHTTLLNLLPDVNVGVFMSINGIDGVEEMAEDLMFYYTADLMLGLEPWLTVQQVCGLKKVIDDEVAADRLRARKHARGRSTQQQQQQEPGNEYSGIYTNGAYGIWQIAADFTSQLNTATLNFTSTSTKDVYTLVPTGVFGQLAQGATLIGEFVRDGTGAVTALAVPFNAPAQNLPYVFVRA